MTRIIIPRCPVAASCFLGLCFHPIRSKEVPVKEKRSVGLQLIVIAALYLVAALVLGLYMGITGDHSLFSVHSHLGLLGWTTMALAGMVYLVVPACGRSRLARVHFWLHNAGLPVMMVGLFVVTRFGDARLQPAVGLGSYVILNGSAREGAERAFEIRS
jgi:hypothetical protein